MHKPIGFMVPCPLIIARAETTVVGDEQKRNQCSSLTVDNQALHPRIEKEFQLCKGYY